MSQPEGARPQSFQAEYLKSILTDEVKHRRVEWALRFVRELPGGKYKFDPLTDMVCLDVVLSVHPRAEVLPVRWRDHTRPQGATDISHLQAR